VSECPVQLGRENELRIYIRDKLAPIRSDFGLDVPVEGRVDLDGVEIFRIELQWRLLQLWRIELSVPIFVLPARGADVDATQIRGCPF
jgi:hypothetical protein